MLDTLIVISFCLVAFGAILALYLVVSCCEWLYQRCRGSEESFAEMLRNL